MPPTDRHPLAKPIKEHTLTLHPNCSYNNESMHIHCATLHRTQVCMLGGYRHALWVVSGQGVRGGERLVSLEVQT